MRSRAQIAEHRLDINQFARRLFLIGVGFGNHALGQPDADADAQNEIILFAAPQIDSARLALLARRARDGGFDFDGNARRRHDQIGRAAGHNRKRAIGVSALILRVGDAIDDRHNRAVAAARHDVALSLFDGLFRQFFAR